MIRLRRTIQSPIVSKFGRSYKTNFHDRQVLKNELNTANRELTNLKEKIAKEKAENKENEEIFQSFKKWAKIISVPVIGFYAYAKFDANMKMKEYDFRKELSNDTNDKIKYEISLLRQQIENGGKKVENDKKGNILRIHGI